MPNQGYVLLFPYTRWFCIYGKYPHYLAIFRYISQIKLYFPKFILFPCVRSLSDTDILVQISVMCTLFSQDSQKPLRNYAKKTHCPRNLSRFDRLHPFSKGQSPTVGLQITFYQNLNQPVFGFVQRKKRRERKRAFSQFFGLKIETKQTIHEWCNSSRQSKFPN